MLRQEIEQAGVLFETAAIILAKREVVEIEKGQRGGRRERGWVERDGERERD